MGSLYDIKTGELVEEGAPEPPRDEMNDVVAVLLSLLAMAKQGNLPFLAIGALSKNEDVITAVVSLGATSNVQAAGVIALLQKRFYQDNK